MGNHDGSVWRLASFGTCPLCWSAPKGHLYGSHKIYEDFFSNFFVTSKNVGRCTFISDMHLTTMLHTYYYCKLDYCNTLYIKLSLKTLCRQELVQNVAVWLCKNCMHESAVLALLSKLQWLAECWQGHFEINFSINSLKQWTNLWYNLLTFLLHLRSSELKLLTANYMVPFWENRIRAFSSSIQWLWSLMYVQVQLHTLFCFLPICLSGARNKWLFMAAVVLLGGFIFTGLSIKIITVR